MLIRFLFRMLPLFLCDLNVKKTILAYFHNFWAPQKGKIQNIEYITSTLYFNSHNKHVCQFKGQLKNFQRLDTIFAHNIIIMKDLMFLVKIQIFHPYIFYRCLKDFLKKIFNIWSFLCKNPILIVFSNTIGLFLYNL